MHYSAMLCADHQNFGREYGAKMRIKISMKSSGGVLRSESLMSFEALRWFRHAAD